MSRLAGNSDTYDFYLNADTSLPAIKLTSVTTILKKVLGASPYLVKWAYKLGVDGVETPDEFRDRRAEEGSLAHETVERIVKGEVWDREVTGYEKAWHRFVDENNPGVRMSEQFVYTLARGSGYAGTLDLVFDDGTVVDIKTKKKTIYKAYDSELMQCRAYAMALSDMGLLEPQSKTAILILKDNGRYTLDTRSVSDDMWLSVLGVYEQMLKEGM
jgi:hypothetical protein